MKKTIMLIVMGVLISIGVLNAGTAYSGKFIATGDVLEPGFKMMFLNDTTVFTDTTWSSEFSGVLRYSGGYFSVSFDINAIDGDVAGEVFMRQGNKPGALNLYTSLYTFAAAVETTIVFSNLAEPCDIMQLGISNTDANDSINIIYGGVGTNGR